MRFPSFSHGFSGVLIKGGASFERSATEKRLRQSLYSPYQVLPGLDSEHGEEVIELRQELGEVKRMLQLKDAVVILRLLRAIKKG